MDLAITPTQAFRACHPEIPVPAGDPRYVDVSELRGSANPLVEQFAFAIQAENEARFVKALITGHRGNGKTSELLRLKQRLESIGFFVVYFDIEDEKGIGLSDVSGVELLTEIAERVASSINDRGLQLDAHIRRDLYEYFDQKTSIEVQETAAELGLEASVEVGSKLPFLVKLLGKLKATGKLSTNRKEEVRRNIGMDFATFAGRLNRLLIEATKVVNQHGSTGLVVIVDGLEKLAYEKDADGVSNYEAIFVRNYDRLLVPKCHVIYTVPISLAYDQNLGTGFSEPPYIMPMLNMSKPQSRPTLIDLISRRLEISKVFEHVDDVHRLIHASGGCMRDLMYLVRQSCGPAAKIPSSQVDRAIIQFQQGYDILINEADMPILQGVLDDQTIDGVGPGGILLNKRVVLEYRNDRRWVGIHPAVAESASFKQRLERYMRRVAAADGRPA